MAGTVDVRATTRNVERATERYGTDIEWVAMDVQELDEIRAAFTGADYVISTIGSVSRSGPNAPDFVDYRGVKNMVGIAKDYGVKQFVLMSAASAGKTEHFLNVAVNNVLVWKWLGEDYLRDSGLPYTVIRPVALRSGPRWQRGVNFGVMGSCDLGYIARADAAAVMVASLDNPNALNKTIEIIGDDETPPATWQSSFASIPLDPKPMGSANFGGGQ